MCPTSSANNAFIKLKTFQLSLHDFCNIAHNFGKLSLNFFVFRLVKFEARFHGDKWFGGFNFSYIMVAPPLVFTRFQKRKLRPRDCSFIYNQRQILYLSYFTISPLTELNLILNLKSTMFPSLKTRPNFKIYSTEFRPL